MKKLFEPIVGMTSAIVAKVENIHEVVIQNQPDFSLNSFLFYLMIGFMGALGGWLFKMLLKEITVYFAKRKSVK